MQNIKTKIISIQNKHIPELHKIIDRVARERKYLCFVKAPPINDTKKFVENNILKGITQFVVFDDNHIIGWCDIIPKECPGFTHIGVLGIGLIPKYRNKGIGKQLLKIAINDAFSKGIERIELEVFSSNKEAILLYEKFNFTKEGVKRKGRYIDKKYVDIIIMGLLKEDYKNI